MPSPLLSSFTPAGRAPVSVMVGAVPVDEQPFDSAVKVLVAPWGKVALLAE